MCKKKKKSTQHHIRSNCLGKIPTLVLAEVTVDFPFHHYNLLKPFLLLEVLIYNPSPPTHTEYYNFIEEKLVSLKENNICSICSFPIYSSIYCSLDFCHSCSAKLALTILVDEQDGEVPVQLFLYLLPMFVLVDHFLFKILFCLNRQYFPRD